MKTKKKLTIASIILLVVIMVCILIITHLGNKIKLNLQSEEAKALTPDNIIELLSYIPYSIINIDNYKAAYYGDKVTSEDAIPVILSPYLMSEYLDDYAKDSSNFENRLKELNMEYSSVYLTKDIENYLKTRYNLKLNDIKDISDKIKIAKLDNKYTAFSIEGNNKLTLLFNTFLSVTDASYIDDGIMITEKTLFYTLKDDKYYVYKNTNVIDENIIKVYNKIDESRKELDYSDIIEKIKEDFKDYNGTFKHTYKKNNNGYYWYSTEFVE